VCVCERERERESEKVRQREREKQCLCVYVYVCVCDSAKGVERWGGGIREGLTGWGWGGGVMVGYLGENCVSSGAQVACKFKYLVFGFSVHCESCFALYQ
jgi:hypothetical protein